MDEQHITVKRVTKDDYNRVMDMFPPGEIYNGTDYIPDCFHMLLDMPNNEAFAAIIGGKFVAHEEEDGIDQVENFVKAAAKMDTLIENCLVLYTIVDDGTIVISRAIRTRTGYERQGITNILLRQFQKISMRGKTLQYEVKTGEKYEKRLMDTLERGQRYIVLNKELRNYICRSFKELQKQFEGKVHIESSVNMTKKDFVKLFSNENLVHQFFPDGRLLIESVPYRAIQSNAALMITDRTFIVTSDLYDPERAMLTFMNYFHAPLGLVCKLDVHGYFPSSLPEHLALHFKNISHNINFEKVLIRCFCQKGTNWKQVSDIMSDFGLVEFEVIGSTVICTEQNLMKSSNL